MARDFEVVVAGGGIVGLATGRELGRRGRGPVVVLEAEDRLAAHQSGRNSGVIHSGIYYPPGSLKARLCRRGAEALYAYCGERDIPYERCGKVIVATREDELERLAELERRAAANGLDGVRRLPAAELREREPHAGGIAALLVPQTGIVDFRVVCERLAEDIRRTGGEVRMGWRVLRASRLRGSVELETSKGILRCRRLVGCAGLQSDRLARRCGVEPGVRILPFRGDYYRLADARRGLVRHLVYPVPDPRFPFLGPHLTRRVDGSVEAGPTALPILRREGYGRLGLAPRDALEVLLLPGLWRLARRHWRTALEELRRSLGRRAFAAAVRPLVPDLRARDLRRAGRGVRAQAIDAAGELVDDFRFAEAPGMLHVLNAPSPAATAALALAEELANQAETLQPDLLTKVRRERPC